MCPALPEKRTWSRTTPADWWLSDIFTNKKINKSSFRPGGLSDGQRGHVHQGSGVTHLHVPTGAGNFPVSFCIPRTVWMFVALGSEPHSCSADQSHAAGRIYVWIHVVTLSYTSGWMSKEIQHVYCTSMWETRVSCSPAGSLKRGTLSFITATPSLEGRDPVMDPGVQGVTQPSLNVPHRTGTKLKPYLPDSRCLLSRWLKKLNNQVRNFGSAALLEWTEWSINNKHHFLVECVVLCECVLVLHSAGSTSARRLVDPTLILDVF